MKTIRLCALATLTAHLASSAVEGADRLTLFNGYKPQWSTVPPPTSLPPDDWSPFGPPYVGVSYITPPVSTRLNYGLPVALRSKELTPRTTDAAESINADAMRQYQRRWESHGAQQGTSAQPILYPSKIQRILE